LLCETVGTLFGNARDEKLRRVLELTYFQPAPKQEAVAHRLSLSFGTYRRHLGTARDRLARWLWENSRIAQAQSELPSTPGTLADGEEQENGKAISPEAGAPRLSLVVLPFINIGGTAEDDHLVDGITETLTPTSRDAPAFRRSRGTLLSPIRTNRSTLARSDASSACDTSSRAACRMWASERASTLSSSMPRVARIYGPNASTSTAPTSSTCKDEVTTRLAHEVHIELIAAESRRAAREHPDHLDSVDHTLHGWAAW
jgi:hypothetical protein